MTTTAEFIAGFEGFSAIAYWDVNAWRLGYGSDTEGPDQIHVTEGMTTTRPRALQNLTVRIPQFQAIAIRAMGSGIWNQLNPSQQTAITSIVYNYGRLPINIDLKDPAKTAWLIRALQTANGGVNRKRRIAEAALYESKVQEVSKPDVRASEPTSSWPNIPWDPTHLPPDIPSRPVPTGPKDVPTSAVTRRTAEAEAFKTTLAALYAERTAIQEEIAFFEEMEQERQKRLPGATLSQPVIIQQTVASADKRTSMAPMTTTKPAIASTGVWGAIIAAGVPILSQVFDMMGHSVDPKLQAIGSALGGLLALYGRISATSQIGGVFKP